jgi:type I restriction enzyme M protein
MPSSLRFDVILTNPPFGTKGSAQAPVRDDFVVEASNKQLNFVQHVMTLLKPGGRAAVVVPDNVLFADQAGEVFKVLMEDCNVHTVLRCPRGTFAPYTAGTKTNVLFFTKAKPTRTLWLYDARANVPAITKKARPLTAAHFADFERCYGSDPNGEAKRSEADSRDDRWRRFSNAEIIERGYKIDSFKWLRDEELDDPDVIFDPSELVTDAIAELQAAVLELHRLQKLLDDTETVA